MFGCAPHITSRLKSLRSVAFDVKDFETNTYLYEALYKFLVYHRIIEEITLVLTSHTPTKGGARGAIKLAEIKDMGQAFVYTK